MAYTTGVILGPTSINISGSSATNIGTGSYSGTVILGNASATAVNVVAPTNINIAGALSTAIGSTSNTGTVAIGNTNSTSVTLIGPVNINTSSTNSTAIGSTSNSGTISIGNTSSGAIAIDCGTAGITVGATANAHSSTFGSTITTSSTIIRSGSGNITNNTGFTVNSGGVNYNTKQPAFLAYLSAPVTDVTGDGTTYTVAFNTTLYDQASNFNTGTFTFTAPITGIYCLQSSLIWTGLTVAHTNAFNFIVTTGTVYMFGYQNPGINRSSSNTLQTNNTVLAKMSAGDTATVTTRVLNSTLVVGLDQNGSGDPRTTFSGFLVC
ncbi:MAG: hypothetical protein ACHQVS_00605 [Candidatus Babeliales bacterium]